MTSRPAPATRELVESLAVSAGRQKAEPTHHMRERIAAALRGSRPSAFMHKPTEAYSIFLGEPSSTRDWYEGWADEFLRCCDVLELEVIDARAAPPAPTNQKEG